ncbi:MarR family transcriptional regulator [uncultured Hoeflea sp.]|uniref:MarR family winged helix-turn-helix transcriptional regulator n=1 Tax=uncultured Hoeflea sp. TaxID=538666 RepID=UPI0030EC12D2|tara:strand:- start:140130 stop:140582 length:453 start_codon:yes stop_codon:yes gene_type:complete
MSTDRKRMEAAFGFFNEIGIIAQLSGMALEKAMPEGMTMAQFSVLNHLCRVGDGWPPQRIARAMQVTKGAMTGTLKHLEGKGLVVIVPDESDGRAKRVTISPEGRAMRDACIGAVAPLMQDMMQEFPEDEIGKTVPVLAAVRAWLDARRS